MKEKIVYSRIIEYYDKPKKGIKSDKVNYIKIGKEDRDFIGGLLKEFLYKTEKNPDLLFELFQPCHLGKYKTAFGEEVDKTWYDLLLGLLKKYESRIGNTAQTQDFTKEQIEQLKKLLSHFKQDPIKFVNKGQEMFELKEHVFEKLFEKD